MRHLLRDVQLGVLTALLALSAAGCGSSDNGVLLLPPSTRLTADANTVGLWHFNDGSGQTANDSSVNGWDLVFGADGTAETADPAWNAFGRFGKSIRFSAADEEYVSGPAPAAGTFSGNELTVEFWIKTTSVETSSPLSTGNMFLFSQLNTDGRIHFGVGDGGTWSPDATAITTINDGVWHYVALVYDGPNGNMHVYIDGTHDATQNNVTTTLTNAGPLYIGGRPSTTFVNGQIDEVRVSNIARSASEIANNF